jgi:hypothetical protein
MTASRSSSVIENSIRSRRMPALLTTTSSWPNSVVASVISFCVAAQSVTDEWSATAGPPAAVISTATASAGVWSLLWSVLSPCSPAPGSLTTTAAPWAASARQCAGAGHRGLAGRGRPAGRGRRPAVRRHPAGACYRGGVPARRCAGRTPSPGRPAPSAGTAHGSRRRWSGARGSSSGLVLRCVLASARRTWVGIPGGDDSD